MTLVGIQYQEAQGRKPLRSTTFPATRTADGYISVPLVTPRNYRALFDLIGRPEEIDAAAMAKPGGLAAHAPAIAARLVAWCEGRTSAECLEILSGAGLACGAHATPAEVLEHPHLAARGAFGRLEDADGSFRVLNPPFRFDGVPGAAAPSVPRLGEHTEVVVSAVLEKERT
jgi:crotonobetainyl-CoA:carnitine CoA-transferase CaiB-like acyl-CoA transferase